MAIKVSCHCGIIIVFDVKYVTLESIDDSIPCLSCIFDVAPVAFQAVYEVIALAGTFGYCVLGCVIV